MGVVVAGETASLTGESVGEAHVVLECTQAHPPGKQHQKGETHLWVVGEVTERGQELSNQHCSLSDPSHTYSTTVQRTGLPHRGEYLKLHP